MSFSLFFLIGTGLMLAAVLVVIRRHDPALRSFAAAGSVTALALLAGAALRLTEPGAREVASRFLVDTITVANLSAASVLLLAWAVRLWRAAE